MRWLSNRGCLCSLHHCKQQHEQYKLQPERHRTLWEKALGCRLSDNVGVASDTTAAASTGAHVPAFEENESAVNDPLEELAAAQARLGCAQSDERLCRESPAPRRRVLPASMRPGQPRADSAELTSDGEP